MRLILHPDTSKLVEVVNQKFEFRKAYGEDPVEVQMSPEILHRLSYGYELVPYLAGEGYKDSIFGMEIIIK